MKKLFSVAILLLWLHANSTRYYFSSSSGNDSYSSTQAQNSSTPWRTLQKLNAYFPNLKPGDTVVFLKGDVFYGNINIKASGTSTAPIVFTAYGVGSSPVITGLVTLGGWVQSGTNIWTASCPGCDTAELNMVKVNGISQPMGRWPNATEPNKGYRTITSGSATKFGDSKLTSTINWTGATVVLRTSRWTIDRYPVSNHKDTLITYPGSSSYPAQKNFGYFIQNHIKTLDTEGEWYYDRLNKRLSIYSTNIGSKEVKVAAQNILVSSIGYSNIKFKDITFEGADQYAFYLKNANGIYLLNCTINACGESSLYTLYSDYLTVDNCRIYDSYNMGVETYSSNNMTVKNSQIRKIGYAPGMGDNGASSYIGILVNGHNTTITGNTIDSTGHHGIRFNNNSNLLIDKNYINYFCYVKDDGAGIYAWINTTDNNFYTNRKITNNIIGNGIGAGEGSSSPLNLQAEAIYLDDNSRNFTITGNTLFNCVGHGAYIHNSQSIVFNNNTLYNNNEQLKMQHDNLTPAPMKNCEVKYNILFSKVPSQSLTLYRDRADSIKYFGTWDSNYYCRPFNEYFNVRTWETKNGAVVSKEQNFDLWQSTYSRDPHSKITPIQYKDYALLGLIGSNKAVNSTFDANINGIYVQNSNSSKSWNSGGKLDGGALQVSYIDPSKAPSETLIIVNVGSVTAGKNYILKFSVLGTQVDKKINGFLRQMLSPYNGISDKKTDLLTTSRHEIEMLLTPKVSESNACVVLELPDNNGTFWLDNIKLYEANITSNTPDDVIRFEYNASPNAKKIILDTTYIDVKNQVYTTSSGLTLAPYTSVILLKKAAYAIKSLTETQAKDAGAVDIEWQNPNTLQTKAADVTLFPNPVSDKVNILFNQDMASKDITIQVFDAAGNMVKNLKPGRGSETSMDFSSFSNGVYFINFIYDGGKMTRKVIVQK